MDKLSVPRDKNRTPLICGDYAKTLAYCRSYFEEDPFFEFSFSYVSTLERFMELNRFIWESKHLVRFKNEYEGNVMIDLSEWDRHAYELNEYFDAFLYYLKSKKDKLNICFVSAGNCENALLERLRAVLDVRIIQLQRETKKKTARIGFELVERSENVV